MDFEGITVSEISQIEKDILYDLTYVESKLRGRVEWWLLAVEGCGKWGGIGQRV